MSSKWIYLAHDDPIDIVTAQWFIGRVNVEFEVAKDVASE